MGSYIRGYFDGDGSVWVLNNKYIYLEIVSNRLFVSELQNFLVSTLNINKTKIKDMSNKNPDFGILSIGRLADVTKVCNYMYKNATYFLERKRDRIAHLLI